MFVLFDLTAWHTSASIEATINSNNSSDPRKGCQAGLLAYAGISVPVQTPTRYRD